MKINNIMAEIQKIKGIIVCAIAFMLFQIVSCNDPYEDSKFAVIDGLTAGSYIESHEDYSLWYSLLNSTNMFNAITLNGQFTCFVPNNSAVEDYMKAKGYGGVEAIPADKALALVKYHIIANRAFDHASFTFGAIPDTTVSGDFLITKYEVDQGNKVYLNDYALIVEKDIEVINGVIHVLDHVLDPITDSVLDKLNSEPDRYSIFLALLDRTGFGNELSTNYNEGGVKRYITLFVVPDSIYKQANVKNIEDLCALVSPYEQNYTDRDNLLYQYVAYHAVSGVQSFNDLAEFPENMKKKNVVTYAGTELFTVEDIKGELIINRDEELDQQIRMLPERLNTAAKNGLLHEVDNIMKVYSPQPTTFKFDFTDAAYHPAFAEMEFYRRAKYAGTTPNYGVVDPDKFPGIRWETIPEGFGTVMYEVRSTWPGFFDNGDVLYANLGLIGWIEVDVPAIVKGRYKVTMRYHYAHGRGTYQVSFDGKRLGAPVIMHLNNGYTRKEVDLGVVNLRETKGHTVKFSVIAPGSMEVDYLLFEPVLD